MNERDLDGRVVVVTGGSRGIGRAIVLGAIRRGAKVAFCCRALGEDSRAVIAEAERIGGSGCVLAKSANVVREDDIESLFEAAIDRFGRVDIAVHSAGISRDQFLIQSSTEIFDDVLATNLTGAFLLARTAVREFLAAGEGGRIVFIGSIADRGATAQAGYAASKGGLRGLARTLAKEYGHKSIITNIVVAGWAKTELSSGLHEAAERLLLEAPLRRPGTVDEIANAALYLVSPEAGFINGETLYASGGLTELNL